MCFKTLRQGKIFTVLLLALPLMAFVVACGYEGWMFGDVVVATSRDVPNEGEFGLWTI